MYSFSSSVMSASGDHSGTVMVSSVPPLTRVGAKPKTVPMRLAISSISLKGSHRVKGVHLVRFVIMLFLSRRGKRFVLNRCPPPPVQGCAPAIEPMTLRAGLFVFFSQENITHASASALPILAERNSLLFRNAARRLQNAEWALPAPRKANRDPLLLGLLLCA